MTKPTRYKARARQRPETDTDETRQQQMLATIRRLARERGYPPTLREVGRVLGIDSIGHLTWLRDRLRGQGLLTYQPGSPRTICLTPAGHLAVREVEQRKRFTAKEAR